MRQQVTVKRIIGGNLAEVYLARASACGKSCASCGGGCSGPQEIITVTAQNSIEAQPGDQVIIETDSGKILSIAAIVYLLPIILFFLLYLPFLNRDFGAVLGALGFFGGCVFAVLYNKKYSKKPATYTICAFAGKE